MTGPDPGLSEYNYVIELLRSGDIDGLEEASQIIEDFPGGEDGFIGGHWITNAIDCGCVAAIRWVLSKNVDLSFRDGAGYTPLLSALERPRADRYEVLRLLVAHGAPIDKRGTNDWTPLHMAAAKEDLEALALLLELGADPTVRTRIDDYATPLEEARILGRQRSVAFLESRGQSRGQIS